jgi:Arylsulfotransferase (ASST)
MVLWGALVGCSDGGVARTLTIEANPRNVLSAFVSWTTAEATDSVVQFGEGNYEWEVSDSTPVTAHRVFILGMHADTTYQVKAISTNAGGSVSLNGSYTTGSLPSTIPIGSVPVNDTTRSQPGWTLMNVQKGDGSTFPPTSAYPAQAVMYDSNGQPVWYYIDGTGLDGSGTISVDRTDKGVLIGPVMNNFMTSESPREVDFAGTTLWECSDPNCGSPDGFLSHHAGKLSNGDYVVLRWTFSDALLNMRFEELTPDNRKVWTWDFRNFVTVPPNASLDWCHSNAITIKPEKDEVYANCRYLGLVKTSYTNPTFDWLLPYSFYGASEPGLTFAPPSSQPTDTHDPEIHDDGTILVFQNGGADDPFASAPTTPTVRHSSVAEFVIDDVQKTATLTWEFPGNFDVDPWYREDWYQPAWGDADRLPNGNVLVTAGRRGTGTESRVFEVTRDGQVVWELHLGPDMGVYRSERMTPPLIRAIAK